MFKFVKWLVGETRKTFYYVLAYNELLILMSLIIFVPDPKTFLAMILLWTRAQKRPEWFLSAPQGVNVTAVMSEVMLRPYHVCLWWFHGCWQRTWDSWSEPEDSAPHSSSLVSRCRQSEHHFSRSLSSQSDAPGPGDTCRWSVMGDGSRTQSLENPDSLR